MLSEKSQPPPPPHKTVHVMIPSIYKILENAIEAVVTENSSVAAWAQGGGRAGLQWEARNLWGC